MSLKSQQTGPNKVRPALDRPVRLLTLSNGHGEDMLATLLLKTIMAQTDRMTVSAFPFVGEGGAYKRTDIDVIGVQETMPTGGFIMKSPTNIFRDLRAGLLGLTRRQIGALKKVRLQFDAVLAVGDVYPLWLGGRWLRLPLIFVPTAKSEYIQGHFSFEYRLMAKYAMKIFPRDQRTSDALKAQGLPSEYVGNLMMDALDLSGDRFGMDHDQRVVTLLPGSRQDALLNTDDLLEIAGYMPEDIRFVLSVAPGLDVGAFQEKVDRTNMDVKCIQGRFGDVLNVADIVIGLAGTGNEQAAGLGKPVVTFVGRGTQFTRKFALDQKKLLGQAVAFVDERHLDENVGEPGGSSAINRRQYLFQKVAQTASEILGDRARYERMAATGRERMGRPGAAQKMACEIITLLTEFA